MVRNEEAWLRRLGGPTVRADVLPTLVLGFVIIFGSAKAAEDHPHARSLDAAAYALLVLAAATVPLRRHAPLAMLGISGTITGTYLAVGYPPGPIPIATAFAAYAVAVSHPLRQTVTAVVPVAVLLPIAIDIGNHQLLLGADGDWLDWLALAAKSGLGLVPAVIGALVQRSHTYAECAKEEATRRKVEQERLRVAREVHDVVGHSLSIISLQAGVALHVLDRRPEQAQIALEAIRRTSLDALDELRATLTLTRAGTRPDPPEAPPTRPAPTGPPRPGGRPADAHSGTGVDSGRNSSNRSDVQDDGDAAGSADALRVPLTGLARLDGLLAEVRLCGVPVDLVTRGTPRDLPAEVDLAAYRVVQESLTNVMRHAAPARASVSLGYEPDRFTVDVVDEPVAPRVPSGVPARALARSPDYARPHYARGHTPGHGLAGLAERLGELGGSLTAGPRQVRGDSGHSGPSDTGDSSAETRDRHLDHLDHLVHLDGRAAGTCSTTSNGGNPSRSITTSDDGNAFDGDAGWRVHAELPLRKMDT